MEKESPCEFVSAEYIICECGDNFPSEEGLRIHLIKDHGQIVEKPQQQPKPQKKVVVFPVSDPLPKKPVTAPKKPETTAPSKDDTPQLLIFAGNGKPKPIKITKPLYILQTEEIKQEIIFESLPGEDYVIPEMGHIDAEHQLITEIKEEYVDDGRVIPQIQIKEEKKQPPEDESITYSYEDESSQPEELEEQQAIVTYEGQDGEEQEQMIQVAEIYEEQTEEEVEGQEGDIEYEEIHYEEIQYDEEAPEDATEFETVVAGHWLKEHNYDTGNSPREYFCDECGKSFPYEKSVNLHKRVHRSADWSSREVVVKRKANKNVVCDVCGKKYASPAQLRYHQRVHTGEKPYACQYCPKRFTMPLFMQIHVRTHTGERPYQCSLCPKAFTNRAALLRHERVHTGVKPYSCPECGKCFSQSNSMKLHVRTVHMKLPAPYKSKARKLKELRRKELLSLHNPGSPQPTKLVFEDECIMLDGEEKVVISLGSLNKFNK